MEVVYVLLVVAAAALTVLTWLRHRQAHRDPAGDDAAPPQG